MTNHAEQRTFRIYPGNITEASFLKQMDSSAYDRAIHLEEHLQGAPYEFVDVIYKGNGIVDVVGQPTWIVREEHRQYDMNKVKYYQLKKSLINEHKGNWVCINSDGTVLIYPTSGSALADKRDADAFVKCIYHMEPEMIGPIEV